MKNQTMKNQATNNQTMNNPTMHYQVPLRIILMTPPPDVAFALQHGRDRIVDITRSTGEDISFDLDITLKGMRSDGEPNFSGGFVQGPPLGRFIYVTSGTMAGDTASCWTRRAKIPLSGITWPMMEQVRSTPGSILEARIFGASKDGGPVCASVRLIGGEWRITGAENRSSIS